MAGIGRNNFIWVLIAIVVIGIGGYFLGWWGVGLANGETCNDPDGCQCGIATQCARGETCERNLGVFGRCQPL